MSRSRKHRKGPKFRGVAVRAVAFLFFMLSILAGFSYVGLWFVEPLSAFLITVVVFLLFEGLVAGWRSK